MSKDLEEAPQQKSPPGDRDQSLEPGPDERPDRETTKIYRPVKEEESRDWR